MVTKEEAKQAWETIKSFSSQHLSKTVSTDDITYKMQVAVITINEYFKQGE